MISNLILLLGLLLFQEDTACDVQAIATDISAQLESAQSPDDLAAAAEALAAAIADCTPDVIATAQATQEDPVPLGEWFPAEVGKIRITEVRDPVNAATEGIPPARQDTRILAIEVEYDCIPNEFGCRPLTASFFKYLDADGVEFEQRLAGRYGDQAFYSLEESEEPTLYKGTVYIDLPSDYTPQQAVLMVIGVQLHFALE